MRLIAWVSGIFKSTASTLAQTRRESVPDTVTVIFPSAPDGKPGLPVSSDQESPPLVDLKIPEPSPPLHSRQGFRYTSHSVA